MGVGMSSHSMNLLLGNWEWDGNLPPTPPINTATAEAQSSPAQPSPRQSGKSSFEVNPPPPTFGTVESAGRWGCAFENRGEAGDSYLLWGL